MLGEGNGVVVGVDVRGTEQWGGGGKEEEQLLWCGTCVVNKHLLLT